jgi:glycosyltransferase involved in cell wall biosynthesis
MVAKNGETRDRPMVTVGMPVYNGESTLREAIESFLSQTLEDIELIISDNASTDGTAAICEEYAARDPRVRYIRNSKNIGGADNYNAIFRMARGKFFNWAPCDDVVLPRFLETCVEALEANPKAVLAYTKAAMIDTEGNRIHEYERATLGIPWSPKLTQRYRRFLREVTRNYSITVPNYVHGVVRPEMLARTHLQRHYLSQDDNLVAEIILGGEVCEVPEVLKLIRYHPGSSGWIEVWNAKHIQNWYRPEEKSSLMRVFRLGWRHRLEYFRIVLAADATPLEKLILTYENLRSIVQRGWRKLQLLQRGTKVEQTLPWQRY